MSHRWEFGPEYQKLNDDLRRAKRINDIDTIKQIKPRLDELNEIMWQSMVGSFLELASYHSLFEALEQLCLKNNLPFPDLNNRELNFTGKGDWQESGRFIFGVSNKKRSIQIFPLEDRGYIDIELYEGESCYKGQSSSVEEAAIVLSRWYVEERSIEELHKQFPWLPIEPFNLNGPRVTFE